MSRNMFKVVKLGLFVFFLSLSLFSCHDVANAAMISTDELYKMSLQTGLRNCFNNYAKDEVSIYSLDSYEKFFNTGGNWDKTNSQDVWITTHVGNSLSSSGSDSWTRDSNLSCEQLFKGYPVNNNKKEANGLLQYFQLPTISSSNMTAWGYWPVNNSTTPDPGTPAANGNKVKITITDIKSLDGNNNPLTSSGEIICSGIEGNLTSAGKGQYNWILNCEGEINAEYKGKKLYTLKASFNNNGRKWRAAYWSDGWVDMSDINWEIPLCLYEDKNCDRLDFDYINMPQTILALQSAALNVHDNDYSNKSVLEILNGDARNQEGLGLTWILNKITDNVFKIAYENPSFKINIEAVGGSDGGSGGSSGGSDSTNYKPIISKRTAAEIFAFNLGFNESLPHSEDIKVSNGSIDVKYSQYIWNSTAKYSLYYSYLANMIKMYPNDININGCSEQKPSNGYYFKNKINQWCIINIAGSLTNDSSVDGSILTYTHSTAEDSMYQLGKGTFGQVLEWFKKESSYENIPEDRYANGQVGDDGELDPADPVDPVDPGTPPTTSTDVTCMSSGAAESLGWIVCPIMNWMARAAKDLYNGTVAPALKVEPELFTDRTGSNNDTKDAWNVFQGFANAFFIILFLIVVFSQLTGFGIDNYGVKKILPKLITAAILMNLSYYICILFVDLSNILGNGLQMLFEGLGSSLNASAGSAIGESIGSTVLTAVPILIALVLGGIAIWQNPAIVLSLLVGALGVLIAVFFLFVILAARKAAIIVLTVISPLAFACFILPNTKEMFNKWLKLGQALLLVYPICGLLIGGGGYVSKLLLVASSGSSEAGFFSAFSAMLVGIVPIFFIPTVLKGSFALMGSLGAKISGFGDKLRGGATRGIRNFEGYKNMQRMGLERRTRLKAGLDKNGNLTARGERRTNRAQTRLGQLFGADKRRAAYMSQAKRDIRTSEESRAMLTGALARTGISSAEALPDSGRDEELGMTFSEGREGAYYGGRFLAAAEAGDITNMNAAIEAMRSSNMQAKDIAKIVRYAQNHGYLNNIEDQTARRAWLRDLSKKYGNDFMATDFELNHFARTGGEGNNGNLGGYGTYASSDEFRIDDVKPEDILRLSGDSLAGMISSGKIDQGLAQRVMAMNPNMSADKRIMLGALASGAVGQGVDAGQFKSDAVALAGNRNVGSSTITPRGGEDLATLVARWTAPTAQRATVVQEFFGEEDRQIRPVDVSIARGSATAEGESFDVRRGGAPAPSAEPERFTARGVNGDITFTRGEDGNWRDPNGNIVENFERARDSVVEARNRNNNNNNQNN